MRNSEHGHQDLAALIRAGTPLVLIDTDEEPEVIQTFRHVIAQTLRPLFSWSVTQGLRRLDMEDVPAQPCGPTEVLQAIRESTQRSIYLLLDFTPYLRYVTTVRHLREIALRQGVAEHTVVMIGSKQELPPDLERLATTFRLRLPSEEELGRMVREEASAYSREQGGKRVQVHLPSLNAIARCLRGLALADARRIARRLIGHDGAILADDVARAAQLKFELLGPNGVLHFEFDDVRLEDVAGLKALKNWVAQRRAVFRGEGSGTMRLDPPRGVLLLGVQGCGKSLASKAIAGGFGVPLLRLEMASLYNKFHGETERNLREAIERADQMAPCVLWIDEIEKGLAGGSADDGVSRRVLGFLLTWMAERKHPVFLVATANAIEQLPPELLRKGRFDEIFFVDLPDAETRMQILALHLKRRELDPADFDLFLHAGLAEGFSGAELEQAVVSALYAAAADNGLLSDAHLQAELRRTRPLSVVMAEKVQALREWARGRTVTAD
jgi:AAA+ superfamily predicted ATPase